MHRSHLILGAALAVAALATTGCATKKYVSTEVGSLQAATDVRLDAMGTQIETAQSTLNEHEAALGEISRTAQEAMDRAIAAGKLAEGRLIMEAVLSDDRVRFGFDQATLTPEAAEVLDELVTPLVQENKNVFIEIQGHTDSIGSAQYNLALGTQRAEAVRRHLSLHAGVPLHRMAVISFGETVPLVDDNSLQARTLNRRVTLVVMQ